MALMRPDETSTESESWGGIEEIFNALESPLLGYALRFTADRASAEDLVMEAFMRLQENFAEVREPRRWLFRTVHNLALNRQRDQSRVVSLHGTTEASSEPTETVDPQPLPDEQIARWEGIGLVRLSLETLDARSREVVRLKFLENLSYKDISARTGLTIGHVAYLLHHALKAVASELARNGVAQ